MHFAPRQYHYVYSSHAPDVIGLRPSYKAILQARWNYGWKPVLFSVNREVGFPLKGVDFSFDHHPTAGKNCQSFPLGELLQSLMPGKRSELSEQYRKVEKTRFCNFIYTDDFREYTYVRRDFCQLLARYKKVDCPAKSLNNMPCIARYSRLAKLDFMASCKFSICFEHSSSPWYLTEKLSDAFYAGTVPIYWGCTRVAEYFNPAAFINCHDFNSFEQVVDRVAEIDADPDLYEQYRNAPPILPESRVWQMIREHEAHLAAIVNEALNRRNRRGNPLLDTFRLCQLVVRHLHLEVGIQRFIGLLFYRLRERLNL